MSELDPHGDLTHGSISEFSIVPGGPFSMDCAQPHRHLNWTHLWLLNAKSKSLCLSVYRYSVDESRLWSEVLKSFTGGHFKQARSLPAFRGLTFRICHNLHMYIYCRWNNFSSKKSVSTNPSSKISNRNIVFFQSLSKQDRIKRTGTSNWDSWR